MFLGSVEWPFLRPGYDMFGRRAQAGSRLVPSLLGATAQRREAALTRPSTMPVWHDRGWRVI